ncbi:hypothetical protein MW695_04180 [Alkalihalobacillus sp. APA_J-10(15)]|nr:hypothetical protein [Halalkalibacter sp. APA_J-10(15)]
MEHEGYVVAGDVYDIHFTYPAKESFHDSFILSLEYDSEQFNEDDVFVFYLNEDSDEWELRDGEVSHHMIME